ncbi:MAG: radical SAM protein [Nitrospirae bacterium]|nr:radical SAM protein [Nitrospirota bacterium]
MLRVAMVSSPLTLEQRYGKFSAAGNNQPTYALPCLASIARSEGADVIIIDASSEGLAVDEVLPILLEYKPDVLGISSTTVGINASAELSMRIKQSSPHTITIIGGCHVTAIAEETMSEFPYFDIAVVGEGENTFAEILRILQKGQSLVSTDVPTDVMGTAVRQNGKVILNGRRPFITNLDELPLPAWDLLRGFPDAFKPSPARIKRFPCASIVLARGCPNQCHFCDRSVFGNKVRSFSATRAVDMIKDLRYHYGVKEILMEDDTFIVVPGRVKEFCERLISEKVDITWSCLGRADRANLEVMKLMKRAGCWHISYGVESGDQRILDLMHKGETIPEIEEAIVLTKEAGLKSKGFFMVGFPGETRDSLRLTKELALRLPLDDISVMQLTPFPGTAVYAEASTYGTFERDWRKMNALNTVFVPHGFTIEELEEARAKILKEFYFRPKVLVNKLRDVVSNPQLFVHMLKGFKALIQVITK